MATIKQPLLNLDTLIEREFIMVDGARHELRNLDELDVVTHRRLLNESKRLAVLDPVKHRSDDEEAAYDDALDTITRILLIAPADVHAKLQRGHRSAILLAFMQLSMPSLAQARATMQEATATTPTGVRRPRASRASTAGRRKAG